MTMLKHIFWQRHPSRELAPGTPITLPWRLATRVRLRCVPCRWFLLLSERLRLPRTLPRRKHDFHAGKEKCKQYQQTGQNSQVSPHSPRGHPCTPWCGSCRRAAARRACVVYYLPWGLLYTRPPSWVIASYIYVGIYLNYLFRDLLVKQLLRQAFQRRVRVKRGHSRWRD